MDKRVEKFIKNHRVSVLSVMTPEDKIHSATIHYANKFDPLEFIFLTEKASLKAQTLGSGEVRASLVIGFSEEEWVTLQMHGTASLPKNDKEISEAWEVYSTKFSGSEKMKENVDFTLVKFIPNWWRYSEVRPRPSFVITSEDK